MYTIKEVIKLAYSLDTGEQLAGDDAEAVEKLLLLAIQKGKVAAFLKRPDNVEINELTALANSLTKQGIEPANFSELLIGLPSRLIENRLAVSEADWLLKEDDANDAVQGMATTVRGVTLRHVLLLSGSTEHKNNALKPYVGELLTLDEASKITAEVGVSQLNERDWLKAAYTGSMPLWWPYEGDVELGGIYDNPLFFQGHLRANHYQVKKWLDGMTPKIQRGVLNAAANGRFYQVLEETEVTTDMLRICPSDLQAMLEAAMSGFEAKKVKAMRKRFEPRGADRQTVGDIGTSAAEIRAGLIREILKEKAISEPIPNESKLGGKSWRLSGMTLKGEVKSECMRRYNWSDTVFEKAWELIKKEQA